MFRLTRTIILGAVVALTAVALIAALATVSSLPLETSQVAEAAPPEGQTYTGSKRCASCHFEQFMAWKKTKHAKAFSLLPDDYATDAKCVKCHTTGYGEASGFKDISSTPSLAGITCETCHGPGSKHEEVSQKFKNKKTLSAEEDKLVRGTIWRMIPKNVCVECHLMQGHKKSETPAALRKK